MAGRVNPASSPLHPVGADLGHAHALDLPHGPFDLLLADCDTLSGCWSAFLSSW